MLRVSLLLYVTGVWGICNNPLESATTVNGFCAQKAPAISFPIRGIEVVDDGILVVDKASSQVKLLVDVNGDGIPDNSFVIAQAQGLNHAVVVHNNYLYASSNSNVYRWPYRSGQRSSSGPAEIVIRNMTPQGSQGGHSTRTMAFDKQNRLYISVGSGSNIDQDSFRARLRRFSLPAQIPAGGVDFTTGEVFIDGLRNEVGLAFDRHDVLWGVENSADDLNRADLGGDIHNDNPAEELNRFPECCAGKHFGYPFCFTEFNIPRFGKGKGTLWTWPNFMPQYNDSWCRTQTIPPALPLQPHTAPLGITFFNASKRLSANCSGSFPAWMDGDAFIGYHGSWNRNPSIGYKVVRVPMTLNGYPRSEALNFLCHNGATANWRTGFRPVDVKFDNCNRLLISSDGTTDYQTRTSTGAGFVVVTWDCVQCGAGQTGPQCCSTRATNVSKQIAPLEGLTCPGCLQALPALDTSSGVWRSACACADDSVKPATRKRKAGKKAMKSG